jgi:alpha-galactosidase
MGLSPQEIDAVWVGTNHYYWFTKLRHHGQDIYPAVRRRLAAEPPKPGETMCAKLSQIYGFQLTYPDDGHALEFYPFLAQVKDEHSVPYVEPQHLRDFYSRLQRGDAPVPSPAERARTRKEDLAAFAQWLRKLKVPNAPSDPILGEGVSQLIGNIATGRRRVHIVNIPNRGAIPNLPDHALVEIEGVTDSSGLRGVLMEAAPPVLAGMLHKRFAWQELVADAGVKGDRNLALQALLTDEMAVRPELAEKMLDELLAASRDMLPQFFRKRK